MQNIGIISTREHRHISEIEIDETCVIEFLLLDAIEKRDKNDRPFVTMKVTDGERRVSMRQFGHGIGDVEPLVGGMVRAVVRCTEYNGAPSYAVVAMQKGDDSKRDEYVESSPIQPQRMYDELTDELRKLADEAGRSIDAKGHVARMTLSMLDGNKDAFMTHGAASSVHHAYKGGLLYHSYRMFKLARMVAGLYDVDDEILACAAVLHDIGKLRELETDDNGNSTYTLQGQMFGHAYLGMTMIRSAIEDEVVTIVDEEVRKRFEERASVLMHCVASHHGKPEHGAITKPMTAESMALHLVDMMDSRMEIFEEAYRNLESGAIDRNITYALDDVHVYKPSWAEN